MGIAIMYTILAILSWSMVVVDNGYVGKICCGIAGMIFIALAGWYILEETM